MADFFGGLMVLAVLALVLFWPLWLDMIREALATRHGRKAVLPSGYSGSTSPVGGPVADLMANPFRVRSSVDRLQDGAAASNLKVLVLEGKGMLPMGTWKTNVEAVISILDHTDDYDGAPVLSMIERLQERDSIAFQNRIDFGRVDPFVGVPHWTKITSVVLDALVPPYGGRRDLSLTVRLVDKDNPPDISDGFCPSDHPGVRWEHTLEYQHLFIEKGYIEASEHREEAKALSLKMGLAVAMADGSLAEKERQLLSEWTRKSLAPLTGEDRDSLQELYSNVLQSARREIHEGGITLSTLTHRLNQIGEKSSKYEAIELCFKIMAADGVVNKEEIRTINRIAGALGLDPKEVERIRDETTITTVPTSGSQASVEDELGIDTTQSKEEIRKQLRVEFQKWNNRLTALPEGTKREAAQRMLDRIAEARQRYE